MTCFMKDMMSVILEGTLDAEMDEELGYSKYDYKNKDTDNSRNGYSSKTMHTSYGDMEIDIPRDRKGDFEPQVIKKYQNTVTQDMEEKILSMYAKGMSTADIESHLRELYDIDISDTTVSRITDNMLHLMKVRPWIIWKSLQINGMQNILRFPNPGKNIGLIYLRISSIQRLFAGLSIPPIRLKASIAS